MLKNIAPKPRKRTTMNARHLRRQMSLPEVLLWRELRKRPNGVKFRRQHPTGPYVLDFFVVMHDWQSRSMAKPIPSEADPRVTPRAILGC